MKAREADLADMIEAGKAELSIGGVLVSCHDSAVIVAALRDRARWMSSDMNSGERRKRA